MVAVRQSVIGRYLGTRYYLVIRRYLVIRHYLDIRHCLVFMHCLVTYYLVFRHYFGVRRRPYMVILHCFVIRPNMSFRQRH